VASPLEISVVVSTYQRPGHLRRCLLSLASQRGVEGRFEVIVADDGSKDETADLVAEFRKSAPFPLKFCTHPHDGFQLARCRNSGIRASVAPYILFTDGDCVFPLDHLQRHLEARRPGYARAGDCIRVDQCTSERIDADAIRSGRFVEWIERRDYRALRKTHLKSLAYQLLRRKDRPKLTGWNMAVWRDHLEQINGFDENFRGWGCEDDDLALRLRMSGVRIATSLGYTHGYHLWHPPHATAPTKWNDGANVGYFRRPLVLARCLEGIRSRSLSQVSARVIPSSDHLVMCRQLSHILRQSTKGPELEILIWPGDEGFSTPTAQKVIVIPAGSPVSKSVNRMADATVQLAPGQGASDIFAALQCLLDGKAAGDSSTSQRAA
jgi:glycosyltransferase involved in cell wall biosynthesis